MASKKTSKVKNRILTPFDFPQGKPFGESSHSNNT